MITLRIVAVELMALLCTYAQGTIDFRNDSTTLVQFFPRDEPIKSTDGVLAALYWAPLSDPDNFSQLGQSTTVGNPPEPIPAGRGRFNGGNRVTGAATRPGDTARFVVKIWEAAYGATYEQAAAAPALNGRNSLLAQSNLIIGPTGTTLSPRSLLAGDATTPLQSFSIIPEPSPIALLVAGGILIWILRPTRFRTSPATVESAVLDQYTRSDQSRHPSPRTPIICVAQIKRNHDHTANCCR